MLTADARFEGWSPTDWSRLLSLFRASADAERDDVRVPRHDDDAPSGGLVVVHDRGRVRKVLHTSRGRIDPCAIHWPPERPPEQLDDRPALATLADQARVHWVWALQTGALEELMERFGARVRRGDDALTQALIVFAAFRELLDEGLVESWPRRLQGVPVPTRQMVDRAIETLIPARKLATIALYDRGELWTALVVRRAPQPKDEPARFDLIAGPMQLRRAMGVLSGDYHRDTRYFLEAVEGTYGPIALGVHGEVGTLRRLITSARPGDWARASALRDLVLDPVPSALMLPLGLDATRGLFELAGKVAKRFDPIGLAAPLIRMMGERLPKLPPGAGGKPGFDPLDALRKLLVR
ncbi:MAG: hypothetical protein ACHREM_10715 [Polyangiales bacterium]